MKSKLKNKEMKIEALRNAIRAFQAEEAELGSDKVESEEN